MTPIPERLAWARFATVARVGFNPFRSHTSRRSDLLIVAVAFAVIAALVLWGLFG